MYPTRFSPKWLNKLERKIGRFAIPRLICYIVFLNTLVFILAYANPGFIQSLTLDPAKVTHGEIWRLLTFLFIPPTLSPVFIGFELYLLYLFGEGLEQEWGIFQLNLYYLIGALSTMAVAFFILKANLSNFFLNTSIFLAFAAIYPDFVLHLFFLIPIRVKYIAYLVWFGYAVSLLFGAWPTKLATMVIITNYLLFFGRYHYIAAKTRRRAWSYRKKVGFGEGPRTIHRCYVCSRTEADDKKLEFRVCTDCLPPREYCSEHLDGHQCSK